MPILHLFGLQLLGSFRLKLRLLIVVHLHESDHLPLQVAQLSAGLEPVGLLAVEPLVQLFPSLSLLAPQLLLALREGGDRFVEVLAPHPLETLNQVLLLLTHLQRLRGRKGTR